MSKAAPGSQNARKQVHEDYSLLRADFEFLASAVSNALWDDDRYRDMRRGAFLAAVRRQLGQAANAAQE